MAGVSACGAPSPVLPAGFPGLPASLPVGMRLGRAEAGPAVLRHGATALLLCGQGPRVCLLPPSTEWRPACVAPICAAACRLPLQAVVQVYDLQNKVVAASAPLEQPMAWLLPHEGGACIDVGAALSRNSCGLLACQLGHGAAAAALHVRPHLFCGGVWSF